MAPPLSLRVGFAAPFDPRDLQADSGVAGSTFVAMAEVVAEAVPLSGELPAQLRRAGPPEQRRRTYATARPAAILGAQPSAVHSAGPARAPDDRRAQLADAQTPVAAAGTLDGIVQRGCEMLLPGGLAARHLRGLDRAAGSAKLSVATPAGPHRGETSSATPSASAESTRRPSPAAAPPTGSQRASRELRDPGRSRVRGRQRSEPPRRRGGPARLEQSSLPVRGSRLGTQERGGRGERVRPRQGATSLTPGSTSSAGTPPWRCPASSGTDPYRARTLPIGSASPRCTARRPRS